MWHIRYSISMPALLCCQMAPVSQASTPSIVNNKLTWFTLLVCGCPREDRQIPDWIAAIRYDGICGHVWGHLTWFDLTKREVWLREPERCRVKPSWLWNGRFRLITQSSPSWDIWLTRCVAVSMCTHCSQCFFPHLILLYVSLARE